MESEGYGYFGSFEALTHAIQSRQVLGKPLTGEALVYPGAIVRQEGSKVWLETGEETPPCIKVRVDTQGHFRGSFSPRHDFEGEPPAAWKEVKNP